MSQQSIYIREKIDGKWKHVRKVEEGRGKKTGELRPPFFSRPTVNKKQTWHKLAAQTFKEAKEEADRITAAPQNTTGDRVSVAFGVERFIAEMAKTKKPGTVQDYQLHLNHFVESLNGNVEFMDQITAETVAAFRDWMQGRGYSAKTQTNRTVTVLSLLKKNGVRTTFSLTNDLPTVEEEPAVAYTEEELKKFFAAATPEETIRYRFFLGTGAREQEVTYCSWADLDLEKGEFHVRRKDDVGFTPKSHESRTVPMPTSLIKLLRERKKNRPHDRWVFVNKDGKPEGHFLKKLKRIALKAALNCGSCRTTITTGKYHTKKKQAVSCKDQPVCAHVYLHKFRKSCATNWQRAGIPIRDIQIWLGHKSLEVTQKYLGATPTHKLRGLIDSAAGD